VNAKRLGGTGSTTFAVGSGYAAVPEPIRIASQCEVSGGFQTDGINAHRDLCINLSSPVWSWKRNDT
jgi:hypothetical protein